MIDEQSLMSFDLRGRLVVTKRSGKSQRVVFAVNFLASGGFSPGLNGFSPGFNELSPEFNELSPGFNDLELSPGLNGFSPGFSTQHVANDRLPSGTSLKRSLLQTCE